jgi:DNA adenine methylase
MRRPAFSVKATSPNNVAVWAEQAEQHIDALHSRMRRVYIERMDFRELIPYYDKLKGDGDTVFFVDQPYHVKDPAYVHWFTEQDHIDLADVMRTVKGKWLMTINDDEANRAWYEGFHILPKPKQYSLAKEDSGRKEFGELIISNYPLPVQTQAALF